MAQAKRVQKEKGPGHTMQWMSTDYHLAARDLDNQCLMMLSDSACSHA